MAAVLSRKSGAVSQRFDTVPACINHEGWTFAIESPTLRLLYRDEVQVVLPLTPRSASKPCGLGPWRKVNDQHFQARVKGLGTAHVAVREGHVAFWLETQVKQFKSITYFPETVFNGPRWQSYVSDGWDRLWDKDIDQEVGISSAYLDMTNVFGAEEGGQKDPRDTPPTYIFNLPPRAFSLRTQAGYVGFSIPGPIPVGITRLTMRDRRFSLSFDLARPACAGGRMPVVYIVPGLAGAHDVLDEHRIISEKLGLTRSKSGRHPAWWSKPCYKASLEYIRHWQKIDKGVPWTEQDQSIKDRHMEVITPANLKKWTFQVKESLQAEEMNVMLEQGIFPMYGNYTPVRTLGGTKGFRELCDEFRRNHIHVLFYIHPFMVDKKIPYFKKYPEALCRSIDQKTDLHYCTEHLYDPHPQLGLIDWTHPLGRSYLLRQVEYILSGKPGCLNCDYLRSNHWRAPDPRYYRFHDPDWGIGDMMSFKVQKAIYEKAKSVKPDCCVSKACFAEPYLQPYADIDLLCEDHTTWTDSWYDRGDLATRLIRGMIFTTDPYMLSITKSVEYYMGMAAWCTVEVPDVEHGIHPYGVFMPLKPRDYRRRLAGVKVQENAPLNRTDLIRVERPTIRGQEPTIWRKRTQGPLAGWYASMALGRRSFVTYSQTEARVASSQTRYVQFPLPPGAKVCAVERVPHQGKSQPARAKLSERADETWVDMKVVDAGNEVQYYRVQYDLRQRSIRGNGS